MASVADRIMSTWKVVAVTLAVVAIIVLGIGYLFLAPEGLGAHKKSTNFEYAIANRALGISIPSEAQSQNKSDTEQCRNSCRGKTALQGTLCRLPRRRWQWQNRNSRWNVAGGARSPCRSHPEADRRGTLLHHPKWGAVYRSACVEFS